MYINSESDTERNLAVELVLEDIPGGGVVEKDDFPTTQTEMKEGALLGVDANGIYHVIKSAKITATVASGATSLVISKDNPFVVGDILTNTAKTVTGRAITAKAASGTLYETITIAAAFGVALAADDIVVAGAATGASGTSFLYTPVAVAKNTVTLAHANTGCGLVVRGRVRESLMPYPVNAALKAYLPHIRFV